MEVPSPCINVAVFTGILRTMSYVSQGIPRGYSQLTIAGTVFAVVMAFLTEGTPDFPVPSACFFETNL